ncbi:amidohydrolase [Alkaliphilus serpentinus]|uniref:Amidohydrolase n=1 Tax=Alkaliphilus serpentinus TaxID=1482731 RepID=A0A833HPE8_9FIRM|nr:amidohydrolase [Alkaliphilus serpentinus]KAB3530719.1 amidohydrolase [Alkaliphilus serpentinus]
MITNKKAFINGKILTMDEKHPEVEAMLVEDDKVKKIGGSKEILSIAEDAEIIDLMGKRILPGMNDSHMHLLSYGLSIKKVDLRQCKSLQDIREEILGYLETEEEKYFGDWIVGHGWNEENFSLPEYPIAEFLDDICKDRPIYISRACYHMAAVNHKALQLAGIDNTTQSPEGGKIDKYEDGKPTGVLRENALLMAYNLISISDEVEVLKKLISDSVEDGLRVGLTSIQSDDFGHVKDYNCVVEAYKSLEEENALNVRINLQMLVNKSTLEKIIASNIKTGTGSDLLKYGPLKVLADGSLGGRTAALQEAYEDDKENNGILIHSRSYLRDLLQTAAAADIQLAVHAIGDRTMVELLDLYEEIYLHDDTKRPRLIHCQITNKEILEKMAKLKVIADIQPSFVMTDMKMVENRVGKERAKDSYIWKSMLNQGVMVAGSSDAPIESFNPFWGIYAAVTRRNLDEKPEGGWYPEECLAIMEAIRLYTVGSSYATFEEEIKGKLKEGYLADFIVLDKDIMEINPLEIKDLEVEATYVGGECVYKIDR